MNKRIKKKTAKPRATVVSNDQLPGKEKACESVMEADDYVVFTVNFSGKNYGMNCATNLPAERFDDFIINAAPGFVKQKNDQLNTNPN